MFTTVAKQSIVVVTDGAGAATAFSEPLSGRIVTIRYVKAGAAPYADGTLFTITLEATGEGLWTEAASPNASKTVAPRQPTHDLVGATAAYAAGGTLVRDHIYAAYDRMKIVLSGAGAAQTGTFHITVAE